MSTRGVAAASVASLVLHGAAVLGLVLGPAFRIAPPPIPIEIRPVRRVAPRPPPADPRPPAPPPASASRPPPRPPAKDGPSKKVARAPRPPTPPRPPAPPPPPGPPTPPQPPMVADLHDFAPGDARLQLLLRTDRMRRSPHRQAVEQLLRHLPDHDTLIGAGGLSAFDDFDALLIATSNPFDVTATFLAARHAGDGRVRGLLSARKLPPWDPRTLRYPEPTLTLLARPTMKAPSTGRDGGADEDPEVLEARWLDNLSHFERAAGDKNGPALLIDVEQLGALGVHSRDGGLPIPVALSVAATPSAAPLVRIRLQFATDEEARRFFGLLPWVKQRLVDWRPLVIGPPIGSVIPIGVLLEALQPSLGGTLVELTGELPAEPFAQVLAWIPRLMPHQPAATATVIPAAPPTGGGPATGSAAGAATTTPSAPAAPRPGAFDPPRPTPPATPVAASPPQGATPAVPPTPPAATTTPPLPPTSPTAPPSPGSARPAAPSPAPPAPAPTAPPAAPAPPPLPAPAPPPAASAAPPAASSR